jgi:oxalate decarboxylase/phosphoglucose isomerase-like protein (cupin superfamily)
MLDKKNSNKTDEDIIIKTLDNSGDHRGDNFLVPHESFASFGKVDAMHIADIQPGAIRGNHYHIDQKEILVVLFKDSWQFGWGASDSDNIKTRDFNGAGAVLIEISPQVAHAVSNTGDKPMTIVAVYDAQKTGGAGSQTVRKVLL